MAPYNGLVTAGVNLYLVTRGDPLAALALAPGYPYCSPLALRLYKAEALAINSRRYWRLFAEY
jgi:hypothetical protein